MARMPKTIRNSPMTNVIKPNIIANMVLFQRLQVQNPIIEVNRVIVPTINTGKAYPDQLIEMLIPYFLYSGGISTPDWMIPIIITPILSINIAADIKAT